MYVSPDFESLLLVTKRVRPIDSSSCIGVWVGIARMQQVQWQAKALILPHEQRRTGEDEEQPSSQARSLGARTEQWQSAAQPRWAWPWRESWERSC